MDTLVGTSIGGYTLVKLLGSGGMGSVYLATDTTVGQQVAVKLIRTELDGFTDSMTAQLALERFRQEARAVAGLDHLHILPLNRYGEEQTAQGPRAYMIMQYRPEGSLWDWLRRRADMARGQIQPTQAELSSGLPMNWPLGLEEAADYLQQAASALQYAHERSIVHRDVKPANFLLRLNPQEKRAHLLLGDFGLAKVFTGSSSTQTILGTPTYMAPEQFEGAARPESDQYALAVMIYYLLAGRPPFEGDPMQLMRQHMVAPVPSITSINPEIPPIMDSVFARALAKQPEQRFPSIAAFADAFAQVARQAQSGQMQQASRLGEPAPYAAAASRGEIVGFAAPGRLAAGRAPSNPLVLPGPGESAVRRGYETPLPPMAYPPQTPAAPFYSPSSPPPQMSGNMYGAQNVFADPARADVYAHPPAFSPGTVPAFPQPGGQNQNNGKMGRRGALGWILGGAAIVIAGGSAALYFYTKSDAPGSAASGTPANPALYFLKGHSGPVTSLSWLPSGGQIASGSLDQTVRFWSTTNGSPVGMIQTGSAVNTLAWSPNGSRLATGAENHDLELWNSSGALVKREIGWDAPIKTLAWSGDNSYLYLGTFGNGLHALQLSNYKHWGRNTPLVYINAVALSPDGTRAALALAGGRVSIADLTNNWATVATIEATHQAALSAAWSPDNTSLVVGYADGEAVVYDASSRKVLYLLKHNSPVYAVAWKPDSTAAAPILVSGAGDSTVNIWNIAKDQQIIYSGHSDAVYAVTWNATMLASASKDQTVILWQPPTL